MATGQALPSLLASALPPTLGTGCHVVLVDGTPVSDQVSIASLLVPDDSGNSVFRRTLSRFVADLELGRLRDREIEDEAVAQIRSLQARGLRVTHIDSHKHTHMFPRVLRPLLRAALQCGVRAIRNPFEPAWSRSATAGAPLVRRAEVRLLAGFRAGFLREVERAGMRTTAGALGVLATGTLDPSVLDALLGALNRHGLADATYELVCHPGVHDAELAAQRTRLQAEREVERAALLAAIPRCTGPGAQHQLIHFGDL